jgi:hypothetical protein
LGTSTAGELGELGVFAAPAPLSVVPPLVPDPSPPAPFIVLPAESSSDALLRESSAIAPAPASSSAMSMVFADRLPDALSELPQELMKTRAKAEARTEA